MEHDLNPLWYQYDLGGNSIMFISGDLINWLLGDGLDT